MGSCLSRSHRELLTSLKSYQALSLWIIRSISHKFVPAVILIIWEKSMASSLSRLVKKLSLASSALMCCWKCRMWFSVRCSNVFGWFFELCWGHRWLRSIFAAFQAHLHCLPASRCPSVSSCPLWLFYGLFGVYAGSGWHARFSLSTNYRRWWIAWLNDVIWCGAHCNWSCFPNAESTCTWNIAGS